MSTEAKLQSEVIKWLRSQHCFVMKCSVMPGIPAGTSDVFFCYEGFYGFIEVKKSKTAKFQPLQPEFLEKMHNWSWAKAVYPENWDEIKQELEGML